MLRLERGGQRARRHLLIVVAIAALAAGIAWVVSTQREAVYTSTAKVAFIEDTRFDYADAERDRLIGHVEQAEGQAIVDRDEVVDTSYIRPSRQTFLDVVVRATTPEAAADAANALAELIVGADQAGKRDGLALELEALREQQAGLEAEIASLAEVIATESEREAFAESGRFDNGPETLRRLTIELRDAQDTRVLATRLRNQLGRISSDTQERIVDLELQAEVVLADVRVVRPAVPSSDRTSVGPATTAYAVFLVIVAFALLLAMLQAPYLSSPGPAAP